MKDPEEGTQGKDEQKHRGTRDWTRTGTRNRSKQEAKDEEGPWENQRGEAPKKEPSDDEKNPRTARKKEDERKYP